MSLLKPVYTSEVLSFLGVRDKLFPAVVEHPFLIFALRAISQTVLMDRRLAQSVSLINQYLRSQMAANVYSEHLRFCVAEICVSSDSVRDSKPRRLWVVTPGGTSLISKNRFIFCCINCWVSFVSDAFKNNPWL